VITQKDGVTKVYVADPVVIIRDSGGGGGGGE
jgi:hypothetical protein